MKRACTKWMNTLLAALLALLGFNSCEEPRVEYGTPNADYTVKGKVVNKVNQQPVKGIRVGYSVYQGPLLMYGVLPTPFRPLAADTTETAGTYKFTNRFSAGEIRENEVPVFVQDVDGEANGLFRDTVITVDFDKAVKSGKSKGWYQGERTLELNVELEPEKEGDE